MGMVAASAWPAKTSVRRATNAVRENMVGSEMVKKVELRRLATKIKEY
jgi:hypothetical protein